MHTNAYVNTFREKTLSSHTDSCWQNTIVCENLQKQFWREKKSETRRDDCGVSSVKNQQISFSFRSFIKWDCISKRNFTTYKSVYILRRIRQSDGCQIHALSALKIHTLLKVYIQVVSRIFNQMFSEVREREKKTTKKLHHHRRL